MLNADRWTGGDMSDAGDERNDKWPACRGGRALPLKTSVKR